jgi:PKD domain
VIVIAAVIIVAALGGLVYYLITRGPAPAAATLDHVNVSAARSSIDQVGNTTVTARAIDSNGVDETANATFSWSASPAGAVRITASGVPFTITAEGIQGGPVTLSASATWKGITKIGTASLTVQALHFQLIASTSAPLIGQSFILTARAAYANNSLAINYAGTVSFTSDDPTAALPPNTAFTPGNGIYLFSGVIVNKTGAVHITIVDTVASTLTGSVTVTGNQAPVANFTVSHNAADPRQVSVDGSKSSDPDGDALTYAWTFGDAGSASGVTATHTYANTFEKAYTIRLNVTDVYGAASSLSKSYLAYVPPTASYAVEKMNSSGSQIYVQVNASTSASNNLAGVLLSYDWSWGDTSSSTVATKVTYHIYGSSYNNVQVTLALAVHDNYSLSGTVSKSLLVTTAALPPVAQFTQSINNNTRSVSVDGSGSRSPILRTIVAYNWTWGDGSWSGNLTVPTASHRYASDANFTITLTVWDSGTPSLSGSANRVAWVQQPPLPPWVFFSAMRTLLRVAVDASATTDPNKNIATYTWNWGDGTPTETHPGPTASHNYTASGAHLITLTVTDTTNLKNSTAHYVSVATSTIDYRYYDFFNVPYGQWWDYRTTIGTYGDIPPNVNCFNLTSGSALVSGHALCNTSANTNLPKAETYPYTNWYPLPGNVKWNNPGNDPLVYAPYRFNATGVDVPGYNLSEPVYLPVRNYAAPIGQQLSIKWYLQYIDSPTDQALRSQGCAVYDSTVASSGFDGFVLWSRINVTTDLAESKRIFGIPLNYTAGNAQTWWNANTKAGYANYGALETWFGVNTGVSPTDKGWFAKEGNGKYDVFSSFQYAYTPFCTEIVGKVDPSTGITHVYISHVAWATEVLLARWFYWGNTSYATYYLDSTKARGWWGMELAWFEDMRFNAALDANGLNFTLDTVMQYHFEAGSFPGADGKYRTQTGEVNPPDDVPYWTWWPDLTDYITAAKHPSELLRYTGQNYIHSTAGSGNYALNVSFDYVPITWNLKAGQTWSFAFPRRNVVFYNPNTSPIPSNPQGQLAQTFAPLKYNFTFPGSLGGVSIWNGTANTWSVFGPTNTGGPDSSGPGKYPAVWPYPSIFFTPDPPGAMNGDRTGDTATVGSLAAGSLPVVAGFANDWADALVAVPSSTRSEIEPEG